MDHEYIEYILFFIFGFIGALAHQLVDKNVLLFPKRITDGILLGFIGPCFVGGIVGAIADGSCVAATLAGYVGVSVLDKFLPDVSIKKDLDLLNNSIEDETN